MDHPTRTPTLPKYIHSCHRCLLTTALQLRKPLPWSKAHSYRCRSLLHYITHIHRKLEMELESRKRLRRMCTTPTTCAAATIAAHSELFVAAPSLSVDQELLLTAAALWAAHVPQPPYSCCPYLQTGRLRSALAPRPDELTSEEDTAGLPRFSPGGMWSRAKGLAGFESTRQQLPASRVDGLGWTGAPEALPVCEAEGGSGATLES
jgi:hypothetical protein